MTKDEQIAFVKGLSEHVASRICQDIAEGKMPESWDGIELRYWLARRFDRVAFGDMSRKRKREFNNWIAITNWR